MLSFVYCTVFGYVSLFFLDELNIYTYIEGSSKISRVGLLSRIGLIYLFMKLLYSLIIHWSEVPCYYIIIALYKANISFITPFGSFIELKYKQIFYKKC